MLKRCNKIVPTYINAQTSLNTNMYTQKKKYICAFRLWCLNRKYFCSHSNAFLSLFLPVKLMQCFLSGVGFLPVTPFLEFAFTLFLYHTLFYQFSFYHTPAVSVRNTQRHTTVHHSNLVLSGGILAFVWTRHLLFNWSHNVQFLTSAL